jgi:hypothetical protein
MLMTLILCNSLLVLVFSFYQRHLKELAIILNIIEYFVDRHRNVVDYSNGDVIDTYKELVRGKPTY